MQSTISRLALFQFLAVGYSILGVGTWMKLIPATWEPRLLATLVRDYGCILLLLPSAWLLTAALEAHRPKRDTGDAGLILSSGIGVLGFLLLVGFFATVSAMSPATHLLQTIPQATPVPTRLKGVME